MNSILIFFILLMSSPTFVSFGECFAADEPRSALDNSPSVDAAALPASSFPSSGTAAPPPAAATAAADPTPEEVPVAAKTLPAADNPPPTPAQGQASYVYDLKKLIIKSRENIRRVNDKIKEQAVIKRNQKREERAREYYLRGQQLSEDGKLDQAREYFEKAIRITEHPEMQRYIQQSEFKLKAQEKALKREQKQQVQQLEAEGHSRQQEAQQSYETAVRLYREKKYPEAKDQFEHVEDLVPDYKGTRSYLRIIDQDIVQNDSMTKKEQRVEIDRQQKEAEAARQREKTEWKKEIEHKEVERKHQINQQADAVYDDAVVLYKEKKFTEAKKKFQQVEWVVPDYKAARNYLARIDKDIDDEEKKVEAEKAKILAQQEWEEQVEKSKKAAADKRAAEEQEKKRLQQLHDEAGFLYQAAVKLFDKEVYDDAKEKFTDIEKILPGYKSTRVYLAKVTQLKADRERREAERAAAEAKRKTMEEEKARKEKAEAEARQQQRKLEAETEALYSEGMDLFNQKDYAEAKAKFLEADKKIASYKKVQDYIRRCDERRNQAETMLAQQQAKAKEKAILDEVHQKIAQAEAKAVAKTASAEPSASTATSEVRLSKEEEFKQAKEIAALAQKSSELFRKIRELADDRRIAPVKKKMAQVDEVLNKLKSQKEDLLRQIRMEEERVRQEEIRRKQQEAADLALGTYDEAIVLLRNKKFDEAKVKFQAVEKAIPNFKGVRRYLSNIDQDRANAEREAVLERTRSEEIQFKELQEKEKAAAEARRQEEQERRAKLQEAQEKEIDSLVEKASLINDDILVSSKQSDFQAAKAQLGELEKILDSLQDLRKTMQTQEQEEERRQKSEALKTKAQEEEKSALLERQNTRRRLAAAAATASDPAMQRALKVAKRQQVIDVDKTHEFKQRDVARSQKDMYREAVTLYDRKKYTAAKVMFNQLASEGDQGARAYLRKIDRLMDKREAAVMVAAEKQRSEFLADQMRQQRLAKILREKELIHQRGLTRALEKQRQVAEDAQQRGQVRKEALKLKDKENAPRRSEEKTPSQFIKLRPQGAPKGAPTGADKGKEKDLEKDQAPVPSKEEEREAQVEYSNKRKEFLEAQYNKEQKEKEQVAQQEQAQQRKVQEEKRRQELKAQQEQFIAQKKEKALREKEAREKQKELDAQAQAIRQKLLKGAEDMYREGVRLFKTRNFSAAARKFQDIEDILPNYKKTRFYIDKAHRQAVEHVPPPQKAAPPKIAPPAPAKHSKRDETILQTLDVFDTDAHQ